MLPQKILTLSVLLCLFFSACSSESSIEQKDLFGVWRATLTEVDVDDAFDKCFYKNGDEAVSQQAIGLLKTAIETHMPQSVYFSITYTPNSCAYKGAHKVDGEWSEESYISDLDGACQYSLEAKTFSVKNRPANNNYNSGFVIKRFNGEKITLEETSLSNKAEFSKAEFSIGELESKLAGDFYCLDQKTVKKFKAIKYL